MRFCDICGRQAVTMEFAVVDGKGIDIYLCDKCLHAAQKNNLSTSDLVRLMQSADGKYCPVCGTTKAIYKQTFKFGCSSCYEYMRDIAVMSAERTQDSTHHTGKAPRR